MSLVPCLRTGAMADGVASMLVIVMKQFRRRIQD